jgi:tyrosyl-tRNA synthetase
MTTARIGDPTDRLSPRQSAQRSERRAAMVNMHLQLKKLGVGIEACAGRRGYSREWAWRRDVTNNNIWYQKLSVGEFMRVLGSGVRLGPLLGRDT